VRQGTDSLDELAAERGVHGELSAMLGFGNDRLDFRTLSERDRIFVAYQRHVVDTLRKRGLAAEGLVDGLYRDSNRLGNPRDCGVAVPLLVEFPVRRVTALGRRPVDNRAPVQRLCFASKTRSCVSTGRFAMTSGCSARSA
jgi:hypothetical protein